VAAINDRFGLDAKVVAGHNGILKVTRGDAILFDNQSRYLPSVEEVISAMEKS
jgi:hypothetical protein